MWFFESLAINPNSSDKGSIHTASALKEKNYYIRSVHDNDIYLAVDASRPRPEMKLSNDGFSRAKVTEFFCSTNM